MAVGTIVLGEDAVISVSTTVGGTYEPISDLNSYTYNSNRNVNNFAVFQRATAHGVAAARELGLTLSGLYSVGDSGQDMIRAADAAGTNIFIKLLPDGTNGITLEVRTASIQHSGTPDDPGEVSFEFAAAGTPADVGTGL